MGGIGYTDAREGDLRFVRHSWVESFRTSHYAGMVPMNDYFRVYHRVVRKLMERDGVKVKVAYNPDYPTQIFGYCCYEEGFTLPLLHYIYVKDDFRQLPSKDDSFPTGMATLLLEACRIQPKEPYYYTFKTGAWARLVKWGGPFAGGVFRPLYARFQKDEAVLHEKESTKERTSRYQKPKPHTEEQSCA